MKALEVQPAALIQKLKEKLERLEELMPPRWSRFVKTGAHKERVPDRPDWWHVRAASILRRLYLDGPVGVSRLRTYYGGRQNRGQAPEHFRKGGGKIIRTILQQLEHAGLTTKAEKNGRKLTPKGIELLEKTAEEVKAG
jgi:small subunit ribosomal protein S19e